ncbi:MAG: ATP-binding cassette domain-containing protein [Acidimicrobiia bacterium]
MSEFLSLVVSGVVSGAIYAILASGLVLTFQTSGIFNFAHGAVAFATAFFYFQLNQPTADGGVGMPMLPAALLAILVFAPLLGWVLDRVLFRRLATAPEFARIVGTVGLVIALPALCEWSVAKLNEILDWTLPDTTLVIRPPGLGPVPKKTWTLFEGVTVDSNQLIVLAAAALSALVLWLVLRHTRLGLETRAAVDRRDLAQLRGVDVEWTSSVSWMLSATLAGLAGVVLAPIFEITSLTFLILTFASFAAVVFAGLRSLPLAFVGGLAVGVIQNLVQGYAPPVLEDVTGFRTAVPFILLLLALFVFLGRGVGRAGAVVPEDHPPPDHREGLPAWRRRLPWILATVGLTVYVQWIADDFWAGLVAQGLVLGLIFLSFVVVTGLGGAVSLAQATFVTVGGFTAGWLVNHQWPSSTPLLMNNGRFNFLVAALAAAAVASVVGLFVALPSLRFGGLALALATLALAFIGDQLVFQLDSVRNSSSGWSVPAPQLGPFDLGQPRTMSMVLLALVLLGALLIHNLQNSSTGRAVLAVRSSEVAARTTGISPVRARLFPFVISAAIAGLGGAFFAVVNSPMTNTRAPAILGLIWLTVTVTFGVRRAGGAVLAGLVFATTPALLDGVATWSGAPWAWIPDDVRVALDSAAVPMILFGFGAISLARNPDGLLALVGGRARRSGRRDTGDAVDEKRAARTTTDVASTAERSTEDGRAPALALEQVRAGYGDAEVLHGVDLAVHPGTAVALLGANGAGKSTLCSVAAGLIDPWGGRVLRAGEDVGATPTFRRARGGLYLAPEARGVFPDLTVEQNLALHLPDGDGRDRAFGRFPLLADRRSQPAGLLSGGEQQLLTLAPALLHPPDVLVADEPTLGLAPIVTEQIMSMVEELRDSGVAVLLVEEKAREALEVADVVAFMELGRVTWVGPREEADAERLAAAYLGVEDT